MSAEGFSKIQIQRADGLWFVLVALEPMRDAADREYFRRLSLVPATELAGIWPECAIGAVLRRVRVTHPTAEAVPVTFAEWIESEAGLEQASL